MVQFWLLYPDPILKYYTLKRLDRITDKRTHRQIDGQKDDPITIFPLDLSGQGHKMYHTLTDRQTNGQVAISKKRLAFMMALQPLILSETPHTTAISYYATHVEK